MIGEKVYTMINGTETISGSAYMKSMVINGYRVEVTYAKVSDTYKISDAWIRIWGGKEWKHQLKN